jgi:tetratricopeptide (TPR) repeat protein
MSLNQLFRQSLLIVLTSVLGFAAQADEDLLDILESQPTDAIVQEKDELTEDMRRRLGRTTPEQNIFFGFLNKSQFDKALFQWDSAFQKSRFKSTANGRALYSYLLFKNGLKINGLENLLAIRNPEAISPKMKKVWQLLAGPSYQGWRFVTSDWNNGWTKFFGDKTEAQVLSFRMYDPSKASRVLNLLKKTSLKTEARAKLEWQMALSLALEGNSGKAGKVLAHLLKAKSHVISKELIYITAARLLYEKGYLDAAIKYYKRVPRASEYWFVAQEELAWSYIRKGEPQNTLAVTQSLMTPALSPHVGPEAVFLRSLSQLKVCDYPEVVKSINEFRKRFRRRAISLQAIVDGENNSAVSKLRETLRSGRVQLLKLGPLAYDLPRYVSRDEALYGRVQIEKALSREAKRAGKLYALSVSGSSDRVGYQASLTQFKSAVEQRLQAAEAASIELVKRRARAEIEEIREILQKMHIFAEVKHFSRV